MASLALKIPFSQDSTNGFTMIDDFREMIKQNFKMLLLTNPGERLMEPSYGVGLKKYLFSNFDEATFNAIETQIRQQIKIYMPVIQIQEITFDSSEIDTNILQATIKYAIPTLNYKDLLEITI
jgi:hypothetical protein